VKIARQTLQTLMRFLQDARPRENLRSGPGQRFAIRKSSLKSVPADPVATLSAHMRPRNCADVLLDHRFLAGGIVQSSRGCNG
jgi:hypothetical protein